MSNKDFTLKGKFQLKFKITKLLVV